MPKWAILIGIDRYLRHAANIAEPVDWEYFHLRGCVRDVTKIGDVLCERWGFDRRNMTMLVSESSQMSKESEASAQGDPKTSPTYENIISAIQAMEIRGQPGDMVYIQFSGYSMRMPTILPQTRRAVERPLDLAILPCNVLNDGRCLRDIEIAFMLYRLVACGLEVMLVVDGRDNIRLTPAVRLVPSIFSEDDLVQVSHGIWSREGQHTWLHEPDPSASLAVIWQHNCLGGRPYEGGAQWNRPEYLDPVSGLWHGLLSHPMLQLMRAENPSITYAAFLRKLAARFYAQVHPQTPESMSSYTAPLLVTMMKKVMLGGGQDAIPLVSALPSEVRRLVAHEQQACNDLPYSSLIPGSTQLHAVTETRATEGVDGPRARFDTASDEMTLYMQALVYGLYLNASQEDSALSQGMRITLVGGYGLRKTGPPRVPFLDRKGRINLVSGDYMALAFASTSEQPTYLRILGFDSAFGVSQVFPQSEFETPSIDPCKVPARRGAKATRRILNVNLRLFIPAPRAADEQTNSVTEVLRIFASSSILDQAIELPPITNQSLLQENPDPAKIACSKRQLIKTSSVFHDRCIQPDQSVAENNLLQARALVGTGNWCSYSLEYVLHKSEAKLEQLRARYQF